MRLTKVIEPDDLAFYIGTTFMCKSCDINLEKITILKDYFPEYKFYQVNSNDTNLVNKYKITNVPFFMISVKEKVVEIFYDISNLADLFLKLNKYKEDFYGKNKNTFLQT